jgi:hypothetical protein
MYKRQPCHKRTLLPLHVHHMLAHTPFGSIVMTRAVGDMRDRMEANQSAPPPVLVPSSITTSGFTRHMSSCKTWLSDGSCRTGSKDNESMPTHV